MKTKKIPMRMCVVTREKLPKKDLLRVVLNDGVVVGDLSGKLNGKGCYFKKDKEVIEIAKNKKVLNHIFDMDVKDEVYDSLKELV